MKAKWECLHQLNVQELKQGAAECSVISSTLHETSPSSSLLNYNKIKCIKPLLQPFSRSAILWCRDVRVDSILPRCSVSFRSPDFPSSMLLTRDKTCFSRSSILLCSRSFRLFACTELLLLLNCCQETK